MTLYIRDDHNTRITGDHNQIISFLTKMYGSKEDKSLVAKIDNKLT